jgi:hypothetical protein
MPAAQSRPPVDALTADQGAINRRVEAIRALAFVEGSADWADIRRSEWTADYLDRRAEPAPT